MSFRHSVFLPCLLVLGTASALPGLAHAKDIKGFSDGRAASAPRAPVSALKTARPGGGLQTRIVGGTFVADGQYGWTAALLDGNQQWGCGGSLVAPRWVLTAAHCTANGMGAYVRVGSIHRSSGGQVIRVARKLVHPAYNASTFQNDIALLELETPAVGIAPVEMAAAAPVVNSSIRLLGWGSTVAANPGNTGSLQLKQLDTAVIAPSNCSLYTGAGDLCLRGTSTATACWGDSGGPGIVNGVLAGLTSGAGNWPGPGTPVNCGTSPTHNLRYTNVAHYRSWIHQYVPADLPLRREFSGAWYQPSTSGQGFSLEIVPEQSVVFGGWYTYASSTVSAPSPRHRWFTVQAPFSTGQTSIQLTINRNTGGNFNAPPITQAVTVGTARLTFQSCTSGRFDYELNLDGTMRRGSIPLSRLGSDAYCAQGWTPSFSFSGSGISPALNGSWYAPSTSGQGLQFSFLPQNGNLANLSWFTYDLNGQSAGSNGQRWYTLSGNYTPGSPQTSNLAIYQNSNGNFDAAPVTNAVQIGTATLSFSSCSTATLTYSIPGRPNGSIALQRLSGGGTCLP